jgi:hypothetical protein
MSDPPKEQQWKLMANAEYQKVVPIIMNLATASLVIPVVFAKDFLPSLNQKTSVQAHLYWALLSWSLLAGSLAFGCLFHFASAKFVKALYGGYAEKSQVTFTESVLLKPWCWGSLVGKTWRESSYEHLRDVSVCGLVLLFFLGLGCLVRFMGLYFNSASSGASGSAIF